MTLTSQQIKEFAASLGRPCLVGVADIGRFRSAPRQMHPANIFPECKSVISVVAPFPRGTLRGITEGTYWPNYTYYSYNRLNNLFRPRITYALSCFIEDHGWEAVPLYPAVPERGGMHRPVKPGRPAREINLNVRIAAVAAGLGEIGWSKVFLTRKWGPRVRIGTILTDAELEPDPLIKPGTLCNRCMKCVRTCPGRAIPSPGERPPVRVEIGDQVYEWGDVSMGRCTLTHHGLNRQVSPFLVQDFPTVDFKVPESRVSEELAYRMAYTLATGTWVASEEFPHGNIVDYYHQILGHVGYFAICGAQGCVRGCMDSLEKRHAIEQSAFKTAVSPRGQWTLRQPEDEESAGIAEGTCAELYRQPDLQAGRWS
ncbi:MAG TPA: hypothetical protein PK770_04260 [Kiritimatiellia bacterium]|jgi:ferredoxin|nr:hypothetical protein [Kiritimatiellia bacterium]HOM59057.1 hypothetical protein [Kiritimatiellia bacterium]HOR96972.1 hypothetical protein [Kiritimatiellia bacterium]HPK36656.1 hypothetical protein [Kiritimatiellia bacterium]HPW74525.1 hypothetical protein [Kiritimatiellia bacterium]